MGNCGSVMKSKQSLSEQSFSPSHQNQPASSPKLKLLKTLAHSDPTKTTVENIRNVYDFSETIGHGKFGTVKLASLRANPKLKFAIKTIEKNSIKQSLELFRREINYLKTIDHPNVIKFYETYQDQKFFYIVMEYCSGGDLCDHFAKPKRRSEPNIASIMYSALSAIRHIHDLGIAHRDIKPENFLFKQNETDSDIKLIDFGLSIHLKHGFKLTTKAGSQAYMAPEVLRGSYDQKCDLWSLGVMLYLMITGGLPFDGETQNEIFEKIVKGKYAISQNIWKKISKPLKDLLQKLLEKDPELRYSASQAIEHEWFKITNAGTKLDAADPEIINAVINQTPNSKFKKEVLRVMLSYLNREEYQALKKAFNYFDRGNTGYITNQEFEQALKELGHTIPQKEISCLIALMKSDIEESKKIFYSDFLTSAMQRSSYLNLDRLWDAFKHFDLDDTGEITSNNIKEALLRAGRPMSDAEINKMIQEADLNKDKKISFKEFLILMADGKEELVKEYMSEEKMLKQKSSKEESNLETLIRKTDLLAQDKSV